MKTCSKCHDAKPLSGFHRDSSRDDGFYPVCKPCRKHLTKASYEKNYDSVRAKQKAKYWKDPDGARARAKLDRTKALSKDPDRFKAYQAVYYLAHKIQWKRYAANRDLEEVRRKSRAYREANREKVREGVRAWFRRNPHAATLGSTKYRMRLSKAENTLTPKQMAETLEYFGYRCGYCLVDLRVLPKGQRTVDHMLALSRGGANSQDNVIPCCKPCNSRKRDRHMALMAGYIDMTPLPFIPAAL